MPNVDRKSKWAPSKETPSSAKITMAVCHGGAMPGPDDLVGGSAGRAGIELMKGVTRSLVFRHYV
jgi:hypothetical protein